jgi:hypothetical protein
MGGKGRKMFDAVVAASKLTILTHTCPCRLSAVGAVLLAVEFRVGAVTSCLMSCISSMYAIHSGAP